MGTPKNPGGIMVFTLVLISLTLVYSLPIEDTEEVAAAKAEFAELFSAAEAGDHAALAPVNRDVQATQIPAAYIEDTEDVAAAKAAFHEAFEEAESGGLAAKQEPAPVHIVENPVPPPSQTYPSATTACPTARTAMLLTTLLLLFTIRRPTILQPFHASPSPHLPSMGCLTT